MDYNRLYFQLLVVHSMKSYNVPIKTVKVRVMETSSVPLHRDFAEKS